MDDTFDIPDEHAAKVGDLNAAIEGLAEDGLNFLISLGLSPFEAGSVVANSMLRHAWVAAGAGKIVSGLGQPDPEKFIEAARFQIETVRFKLPAETGEAN